MSIGRRMVIRSMALVSTVGLSGCLFAAAAGAGGAIHFSGHTAEAIVERSVDDMAGAVARTLAAEGIEVSASHNEDSGAKVSFEGAKGDLDVRVSLERDGVGTKVRVSAQRNAASWDDDYAKELLAKIIA
jgi:hypothetical protein